MRTHTTSFLARLVLVVVALLAAIPATASAATNGTSIGSNIIILGATVRCPGAAARHLDSTQAAAFMQSWLFESIFGHPTIENPPANLPVCHLEVPNRWDNPQTGTMRVNYADDRTHVWVGMPPQAVAFGVDVTSERWIRVNFAQRARAAFAGHGTLVPANTVPSTTTTTAPAGTTSSPAHSSSSYTGLFVALAVLAVALALAGWWFVGSRRKKANAPST
jgi:hypothetical protein